MTVHWWGVGRLRCACPFTHDGGNRQLGIPTVTDRVIQQAIAQILTPIFDPDFSNNSFGFRPNRNGQQAVKQVQGIIKTGRRFSVDVDLSKFFDRVNHDLLMTYLGYKVKDKRLLKLIKRYLRAGVIDNQLYSESHEGVPQGGLCEALHNPPYVK